MNENNNNRKEQQEDDGSLSFLAIPQDEANKHFNCRETTQQKLINLTFWVCDFIDGVKTKFGAERFLVKIKRNRDDKDSEKVVCSSGVLFGGNANNSANAGLAYANTNNTASNTNANIGSQLY